MGTENCVNIGSGNGLLPDGTKPLPESKLTYHLSIKSGTSNSSEDIMIRPEDTNQ